jgi:hypothetical protein
VSARRLTHFVRNKEKIKMDIGQILTGYVIPVFAIALSVGFWLNGRASARDAKKVLDEITNTTRGW